MDKEKIKGNFSKKFHQNPLLRSYLQQIFNVASWDESNHQKNDLEKLFYKAIDLTIEECLKNPPKEVVVHKGLKLIEKIEEIIKDLESKIRFHWVSENNNLYFKEEDFNKFKKELKSLIEELKKSGE